MFALVDGNNFFVSCERVFQPHLEGIPVVVLSNNDGCIIARSQEVKAMGIPMGAPFYRFKQQLLKAGGRFFSANFALYGDMSKRMVAVLNEYSRGVEVYSIDESFCDLSHLAPNQLEESAYDIKEAIAQQLGLPVCVGIAPTKTLAKLANELAKKNPDMAGVCALSTPTLIKRALKQVDVADIWGIGRRLAIRLNDMGIYTAAALAESDPKFMRQRFSVVMERMILELRGQSCLEIENIAPAKKQIIASRSFGKKVTTLDGLQEAVATYVSRGAEKLRKQNHVCSVMGVYIRTSPFSGYNNQYRGSQMVNLANPTAHTGNLIQAALKGLEDIYRDGYAYHKAGVVLMGLQAKKQVQASLFDDGLSAFDDQKTDALMGAMDGLNQRYGKRLVRFGATGTKADWMMRAGYRSMPYSTSFPPLLTVH